MASLSSQIYSFDDVNRVLDELVACDRQPYSQQGTIEKTLDHCSFGIRCAMTGYPILKNRFYRLTVGKLAFYIFCRRGKMRHDVTAPIPGEILAGSASMQESIELLRQIMQQFKQWHQPLQPHFAYGRLNKGQYEKILSLHIANHLETFVY